MEKMAGAMHQQMNLHHRHWASRWSERHTGVMNLKQNHQHSLMAKSPLKLIKSSDEENTPENDRFLKNGYKAVPPPITGNFLTPRADISFAWLDEYAIRNKIIESQTTKLNTKTSETVVIIEDLNSDDEEEVNEVQTVRPETQTVKTRDDKSGVLTRTGLHRLSVSTVRPVCTARQSVSTVRPICTARQSVSTARPVGTARPSVSTARPVCTARPSVSTARPVCTARPSVSTARPVYATRPIYPRMDNVRPRGSCSPIM
ncbi:hypothetical protein Tco_1066173, partial [Tanacetum coccineum]